MTYLSSSYIYAHHLVQPTSLRHVFYFYDAATTGIYTLSLHDALPIYLIPNGRDACCDSTVFRDQFRCDVDEHPGPYRADRKSTRLNSSHGYISYAVFCLKKKTLDLLNIRPSRRPVNKKWSRIKYE